MKLRCIESSDRFFLTAGKIYKANGEPETDGEDQYISVFNDNMRSVRVKLSRFKEVQSTQDFEKELEMLEKVRLHDKLFNHGVLTVKTLLKFWKRRGSSTRGIPQWEQDLMNSACDALGINPPEDPR